MWKLFVEVQRKYVCMPQNATGCPPPLEDHQFEKFFVDNFTDADDFSLCIEIFLTLCNVDYMQLFVTSDNIDLV